VADVLRAVLSLLQGAQQHRLQELDVGAFAHGLEELGVVLCCRFVAARELQAEAFQELSQRLQLLGRRPLVYAVQGRVLALREEVGRADVRREHAFLDDSVGVIALNPVDAQQPVVVVEDELGLYRLEVDCTALSRALSSAWKSWSRSCRRGSRPLKDRPASP